jgi:hypothetical protein
MAHRNEFDGLCPLWRKNAPFSPIVEISNACKLRSGKTAPHFATAVHAILAQVANRATTRFWRKWQTVQPLPRPPELNLLRTSSVIAK